MKDDFSFGLQPAPLKEAKYWREFSADTQADAESAVATWWSEQRGLVKVSGRVLRSDAPVRPQWTVTIIYKAAGSDRATSPLH